MVFDDGALRVANGNMFSCYIKMCKCTKNSNAC